MNLSKKSISFINRVFRPGYWIDVHPICWDWDQELNSLLDQYGSKSFLVSEHHWILGDKYPIWVSNYPYAYGSLDGICCLTKTNGELEIITNPIPNKYTDRKIPSVQTRLKLRKLERKARSRANVLMPLKGYCHCEKSCLI